jgi:hypothetical protein
MFTTCTNLCIEVINMNATVPRPPSDNVFQVAFKIPKEWTEVADEIAGRLSTPAMKVTRTDVLRQALYAGLQHLRDQGEAKPAKKSRK